MASRYWVGGDGTWNSSSKTNWAATSGGAGGQSVPTASDDVYFDGNSGAGTVTIAANVPCKNIDFSGFTGSFVDYASHRINCYGNIVFSTSFTSSAAISCIPTSGSWTITTNGVSVPFNIFFSSTTTGSINYEYSFSDDFTGVKIYNHGARVITNNHNISCTTFTNGNPSSTRYSDLQLGSSIITCSGSTGAWSQADNVNASLDAGTSTIKLTSSSGTAEFIGRDRVYNKVWFSRGTSTGSNAIYGSNTFNELKDDGTEAHSILFQAGKTQHITTFSVNGNAGKLITLNSSDTATYSLVKDGGGVIQKDYLDIYHCVATPSSTWYAGANSVDHQSVETAGSGWLFSPASPSSSVSSSVSPSISTSPSTSPSSSLSISTSPSSSRSTSPSSSRSTSISSSLSVSTSPSTSPSSSRSTSISSSPSSSPSTSPSSSISTSPSSSRSTSPSSSRSTSLSTSPSTSPSASPSSSISASPSPTKEAHYSDIGKPTTPTYTNYLKPNQPTYTNYLKPNQPTYRDIKRPI